MKNGRRGTILLASMWIIVILTIMASGIAFRVALDARLSKFNLYRIKALYAAKAGIALAQELFSRDARADYDSIRECGVALRPDEMPGKWFSNAAVGDCAFSAGYNYEGAYYAGMSDEARRININTAGEDVLNRLLGEGNEDAAACIIDWRDPDDVPLPRGAENAYYTTLEHPYQCKNSNFSVIEELLLIKGISPQLFDSIKDYVTICGDGKVNINTAPKKVLLALGLTEGIVNSMLNFRNGRDGIPGTVDDGVFTSIDIEQYISPGPTNEEVLLIGGLKNLFTTKSEYFRIESEGAADGGRVKRSALCVIKPRAGGMDQLLSYREY